MSGAAGFVWYELVARDPDAAAAFYGDIVGWRAEPSGMPCIDYRLMVAPDGDRIGGLMAMPAGMPGPTWLGYVGTDDVDATAEAFAANGGQVHMPPTDIPGVGRLALLADPDGSALYVMRGATADVSRAFAGHTDAAPGHVVWNELSAPDSQSAIAFYGDRFGWRQDGGMPMGSLGEYRFVRAGDAVIGAAMDVPPGGRPGWLYYFLVDDIDAAAGRIAQGGGTVVQGPDAIPGGAFSLTATDPEGVRFGLVGARA